MKVLLNIAWVLMAALLSVPVNAQTEASARLDTVAITIGDQTGLDITFTCPANYRVAWPALSDTLIREVEILKKSALDSTITNDGLNKLYHQRLTITSFDSGYYAIPPVQIGYKLPDDSTLYFEETGAMLLEVNSVPVNMEAEIKDIKPPMAAPFTFMEALPYLLIFLLAAAVTFLVFYYIRKRKKAEPIFKASPKPQLPAHRIALDKLDDLRRKKLWQQGNVKEYHTELVDIIRDYLQGQFQIHAAEYTSDEIMEAVQKTHANESARNKLRQTLIMADLVKFAKMQPLPVEHDSSLNNAIDFVKETAHLNKEEIHTGNDNQAPQMPILQETEASADTGTQLSGDSLIDKERKEARNV